MSPMEEAEDRQTNRLGAIEKQSVPKTTEQQHSWPRFVLEIVLIVGAAFVLALVIQQFVVKPFEIPSGSMEPTIAEGDRILCNRFIYRFADPKRGDVAVFNSDLSTVPLIKRIIGLPGDRIAVKDGRLYLNGQPQNEPELKDQYIQGEFPEITVPEGRYFMMGDNRNNSDDSRFIGTIPRKAILGKAFARYWPLSRIGGL